MNNNVSIKKNSKIEKLGFYRIARIINFLLGMFCIILGIYKYYHFQYNAKYLKEFFFPSHFMLLILKNNLIEISLGGLVLVLSETRSTFMVSNFKFLDEFLGKGLFNILISSFSFEFYDVKKTETIIPFVCSIIFFFFGSIFILIYFCNCYEEFNHLKLNDLSVSLSDN